MPAQESVRQRLGQRKIFTPSASLTEVFDTSLTAAAGGYDITRDGYYVANKSGSTLDIHDNSTDSATWYTLADQETRFIYWPAWRIFTRGTGTGKVIVEQVQL